VCTRPGTGPGTNPGTENRCAGPVLSVAKLRVGQEAYQLSGVAQSLDDYYTGAGEAAGRWLGSGAELLGLDGEVDPDDLRAVLAGLAPGSGGLTPNGDTLRTHARRVPGFDLTFKAPKSVSVLYAVTDDPRVQAAIIDAGEAALRDALGWLEREAIHVRRGSGDEAYLANLAARDPEAAAAARIRTLPAHGVVAAVFRHRTSRAGDPLLHWHTLVANLAPGPDGRWTAFVHPDLYRAVRAAGEVFQAALRGELTTRLGIAWRPGRHVPEIAGVPQTLCDQFSKRSKQIDDWLEATGTPDDPAGRQQAVLATRRNKPEVEHERFDTAWKLEAAAAGWGPEAAEALLTSDAMVPSDQISGPAELPALPAGWVAEVTRELTESDSTFTRPQLTQAVAARLDNGAPVATVDRLVAHALADSTVIPIANGTEQRWTTTELLAVERRFLDITSRARSSRSPVPANVVDAVLDAAPSLGDDQATAVRILTSTADGVAVLVGPAGTGKTFTLDTIRAAYQAAGYQVVGAAPSARAAHELHADARIPSSTLHRLLGSWSRGYDLPHAHTLLVIDEAAMAGIRELETAVTTVVGAGGRALLVGDHHQLPEVTAGGGFAALATDPNLTVAQLAVNRRQRQPWEVAALEALRDGHVPAAVDAYRSHGRVVATDDRNAMLTEAVGRWFSAHHDGHTPVLIAGTKATVDALNRSVRQALHAQALLGASAGTWDGREFAIGDRVVLRINDYTASTTAGDQAHVLNGQTATLTARTSSGVVVRLDHDNVDIHLDSAYLDAGGLDHAYALTAHRAQGGTWDLAIAVGADGLYREAGYLVLSRGRHENWLVVTQPELDDLDVELARHDSPLHLPGETAAVDEDLDRRLATSRAKQLALVADPHADHIATLAASLDLRTLEARAAHARQAEHHAATATGSQPTVDAARIDRTIHTATHAVIGATVKALDRNNIGTVTALDDQAGTVRVLFVATDGRQAERELHWGDIQIMGPNPTPRTTLTADARASLDRTVSAAEEHQRRWTEILASHDVVPGERDRFERAVGLATDRATSRLEAAQPPWLTDRLGPRPARPAPAQVWDDAVRHIVTHRERHGVTDSSSALGPRPTVPTDASEWDHGQRLIARTRVWLDTHASAPVIAPARIRSLGELDDRRHELEAILAAAPDDQRELITQLRDDGTLPFDNVADLLSEALATQGDRQRWILEHWPHIVEYAEVRQAIETPGPEVEDLLAALRESANAQVAQAAAAAEPWLIRLATHLAMSDGTLRSESIELLGEVVEYRHRWHIDHVDALGVSAWEPEQAAERQLLATAVQLARPDNPSHCRDEGLVETLSLTLEGD
jgi:conjugative relaxase-like TrwC/TraI family protein